MNVPLDHPVWLAWMTRVEELVDTLPARDLLLLGLYVMDGFPPHAMGEAVDKGVSVQLLFPRHGFCYSWANRCVAIFHNALATIRTATWGA
jgi:hypothetical protein